MKLKILSFGVLLVILISFVSSQPSFNGTNPGCSGSSCHKYNANDVSAMYMGNLNIQVTLSGVQSGANVAGELVDSTGTVVDVMNPSTNNPFILTAPKTGKYLVNAGYKTPSRHWDSVSVDVSVATIIPNQNQNEQVKELKLFQNYPNPFNPSTAIKFSLISSEYVTLKIYNHLGQEVTTLVSKRLAKGNYKYHWDASNFATGVYFYRIKAGDYLETKKMTLLR